MLDTATYQYTIRPVVAAKKNRQASKRAEKIPIGRVRFVLNFSNDIKLRKR